jgi:hypothetical protein
MKRNAITLVTSFLYVLNHFITIMESGTVFARFAGAPAIVASSCNFGMVYVLRFCEIGAAQLLF